MGNKNVYLSDRVCRLEKEVEVMQNRYIALEREYRILKTKLQDVKIRIFTFAGGL